MRYFFLASFLPPLCITSPAEVSFFGLLSLFKQNMSNADLKKIQVIRSFIDLKNVKRLLQKIPLDRRGNMNEKELDEAIVTREGFPPYLYEQLDRYDQVAEKVRHFSKVLADFFREMDTKKGGFLPFYFSFEREWRLLMIGFRSKKTNRNLAKELQYEDLHDPIVAYILAQKDHPQFEFPPDYRDLQDQLKQIGNRPMEQYKALATYRFNRWMGRMEKHPFSVDYILGYFVQFMLVEDWHSLSVERGCEKLNEAVGE